ncbi:ABC transporter ATP-binding protein [Pseudonocardia abyssalis]|jgi:fluoroquinolone transport system ATP-binding protein|uniref:ABC transporter ATP-binding protein n=1 Tax=Pseudonocardia abyssalis TaxID=2792008 RepID=A0ABS6US79_9PSEU|nr:ABC transporter ATP-binding protein [Pseudonocardia abyssalis]MBW0115811.1 ABC transporter ATP-binding protein [Pseudonocardia abyssalis]MBW0135075.1 ABC transporter ATP-binding protein [Pseudonocardia abyssalis]
MSPVIEVDDLVFRYPRSAEPAVRGIGFTVDKGEVFGFLGPSGAGKSTTQKILTGLLTGHDGRASVWGRDPADWGSDYYERIGVSFELPNLYHKLTALENLRFFASLYAGPTEDPMTLLESVDLAGDADTRVGRFSKGMQMRLVFARALLHRPELLFLDEPTSGMDPVNARRVKDIIRSARGEGRTVFLTTHDMATAEELCDRVAFVVDGRIAALDTPAEHKVSRSSRTVRVTYRDPLDPRAALQHKDFPLDGLADDDAFRALTREQHVASLHSQEASLEDVFVDVTGRSIA